MPTDTLSKTVGRWMMTPLKAMALVAIICSYPRLSIAQGPLPSEIGDSTVVMPLMNKLLQHFFVNVDSSIYYAEKLRTYAKDTDNFPMLVHASQLGGEGYRGKGDFARSMEIQLDVLRMCRERKDVKREAYTRAFVGFTLVQSQLYDESLKYMLPARAVLDNPIDRTFSSFNLTNIARSYLKLGMIDSAKRYNEESRRQFELIELEDPQKNALRTLRLNDIGEAYIAEGRLEEALSTFHEALGNAIRDHILINIALGKTNLAKVFIKLNRNDSAIFYARAALDYSATGYVPLATLEAASTLAVAYERSHQPDSALFYRSMAMDLREDIYGIHKFGRLVVVMEQEKERLQSLEAEQERVRRRQLVIMGAVVVASLLIVTGVQLRSNRQKQLTNQQLYHQKVELEKSLTDLKAAQSQLIQSEKMASLGELTAGIAHEIQNPLNFVNNFSALNTELIEELQQELKAGNIDESMTVSNNIKENEQKISHHGKRADSIVKGMLQHSRASTGVKEPTDINALVDEYLRLAYHGLRAKDKTFEADIKTDFDKSIGRIHVIPQDMGRVLLNLITNAFFTVSEKNRQLREDFVPQVAVSTHQFDGKVVIAIKDNGNGIPNRILDKIFQPFFTTKPTGQGTGLGLSLSYDIVKAHGGELKVETTEGEGSVFKVIISAV